MRLGLLVLVLTSAFMAARPASAEAVPPAVAAMMRAAAESDLDVVARVAKAAHPASAKEIDALVAEIKAEAKTAREARLAAAGFLEEWTGSGQLGFLYTTGNTRDLGFVLGANVTREGLRLRHKLNAFAERQTSRGALTRNKYLAGYQLDVKLRDGFYVFGAFTWDKDSFADIRQRFSESTGVGYTALRTERLTLDLSAGAAFRQTHYTATPAENTTTLRTALDFSWKLYRDLMFKQSVEYFIGSELRSTTAFIAPISKSLAAQFSFDVTRQEDVPVGRKKTDTATKASMIYNF